MKKFDRTIFIFTGLGIWSLAISQFTKPSTIKAFEPSLNSYSVTDEQSLKTSCLITGWRKVDCTTKTSFDKD